MKTAYTLILLAVLLSICGALSPAYGTETKSIPPPPWSGTGSGPTSQAQVISYVFEILNLLPETIVNELMTAYENQSSAEDLLAIIYGQRIQPREMTQLQYKLIDYEIPEDVENISATASSSNDGLTSDETVCSAYATQWDAMIDEKDNKSVRLVDAMHAIIGLEHLMRRIENANDPLIDIEHYAPVLQIQCAPFMVYDYTRRYLWERSQEKRMRTLLDFLISDANPNGFTKGNAIYWLARFQQMRERNNDAALENFLKVHEYPACLVYIGWSYIKASKILDKQGKREQALALLAVDVPNIDFDDMRFTRHLQALRLCRRLNKPYEEVKHIQALIAIKSDDEHFLKSISPRIQDAHKKVWNEAAGKPYNANDAMKELSAGFNAAKTDKFKPLLESALLHEWPLTEAVPLNIATNRVLNNNIFKHVVRDKKELLKHTK